MSGRLSYDQNDTDRVIEEEHSALLTVGRWLRSVVNERDEENGRIAHHEAVLEFLVALRQQLFGHFQREEAVDDLCGSTELDGNLRWLRGEHMRLLASMDELQDWLARAVDAPSSLVIERMDAFVLLLERHEAEERERMPGIDEL